MNGAADSDHVVVGMMPGGLGAMPPHLRGAVTPKTRKSLGDLVEPSGADDGDEESLTLTHRNLTKYFNANAMPQGEDEDTELDVSSGEPNLRSSLASLQEAINEERKSNLIEKVFEHALEWKDTHKDGKTYKLPPITGRAALLLRLTPFKHPSGGCNWCGLVFNTICILCAMAGCVYKAINAVETVMQQFSNSSQVDAKFSDEIGGVDDYSSSFCVAVVHSVYALVIITLTVYTICMFFTLRHWTATEWCGFGCRTPELAIYAHWSYQEKLVPEVMFWFFVLEGIPMARIGLFGFGNGRLLNVLGALPIPAMAAVCSIWINQHVHCVRCLSRDVWDSSKRHISLPELRTQYVRCCAHLAMRCQMLKWPILCFPMVCFLALNYFGLQAVFRHGSGLTKASYWVAFLLSTTGSLLGGYRIAHVEMEHHELLDVISSRDDSSDDHMTSVALLKIKHLASEHGCVKIFGAVKFDRHTALIVGQNMAVYYGAFLVVVGFL